jgi:hypothetical protein
MLVPIITGTTITSESWTGRSALKLYWEANKGILKKKQSKQNKMATHAKNVIWSTGTGNKLIISDSLFL